MRFNSRIDNLFLVDTGGFSYVRNTWGMFFGRRKASALVVEVTIWFGGAASASVCKYGVNLMISHYVFTMTLIVLLFCVNNRLLIDHGKLRIRRYFHIFGLRVIRNARPILMPSHLFHHFHIFLFHYVLTKSLVLRVYKFGAGPNVINHFILLLLPRDIRIWLHLLSYMVLTKIELIDTVDHNSAWCVSAWIKFFLALCVFALNILDEAHNVCLIHI